MAKIYDLVRIAGSDLDASKNIIVALRGIKGVNYTMANVICNVLSLSKTSKMKDISTEDVKRIEGFLEDPNKFNVPLWVLNRRKDPSSGEDVHLITTDLVLAKDEDIKTLKKIKSYKGFRHQRGLPLRGQRTKSNFRRNKGKAAKIKRKK